VDSQPGRGTTFRIYLPRLGQEAARPSASDNGLNKLPRGTGTVLLVEDEEGVRSLGSFALRTAGYTVLEARDGEHALEVSQSHRGPIDLLVTDVVMPRMGGRKLADRVASLYPGIKVVFMSGYVDDAVVRHGVLDQGVPFVQKPFAPSLLARKVHEVLGH